MKSLPGFYRFFYWAITLPVLGALPVLAIDALLSPDSGSGSGNNGVQILIYAVTGIIVVSILIYLLLYGKTWIKNTVLSLVVFLISWLLLEFVCGLVLRWKEKTPAATVRSNSIKNNTDPAKPNTLSLIRNDQLGFSRPSPGQYEVVYSITKHKTMNGKSVSEASTIPVEYHIDNLSRRVTPFDSSRAVGKYALFLGCSFTYGESVSDTSTIPYFFGKHTGYRPYNYGVSGHSPAHMLGILQTVNLRKQVAEKNGIAVYTFIEDHLARAIPSTKWAYNAQGYLPWVNPATGVVEGSYAQKHPVRLKLIRLMYRSNIVNLFKINFPKRYSTEQYQRFVNMVKKSKELYSRQFGNDNFYVVVFPLYPMDPELRRLFEEADLKVLDYSRLLSWATAYDGMHPDAEAYELVSQQLAKDLHMRSDKFGNDRSINSAVSAAR
ncbi:hypothetical protein HNV11_17710 [Spirosoma taeanense]|uniref:SGNH/GDSL hydrolase family protein n=1 Tax=Spirosoma taeanense TaxID=2735870 RepID=A0A6M5YCX1_9BACT|nr:hypothetical protein [Spirosoma taeanense]QJW91081.1 hypothetical protein HNV11_17710 [Spirosoma taeanense]